MSADANGTVLEKPKMKLNSYLAKIFTQNISLKNQYYQTLNIATIF